MSPDHNVVPTAFAEARGVPAGVYAKLMLTAFFWGGTFIAGRQVARDLEAPFTIAFLRFTMASVLLIGLTWLREGGLPRPRREQILPLVLLGLTGIFAYNALFFKGLTLIEAGRAALIVATCPAFILVVSAILFKERLTPTRVLGVCLSVLGAVVVISRGHLRQTVAGGVGMGELLILGCVLSWTAYSLLGKAVMRHLSPLVSVSYSSVVGATALLVPALSEGLAAHAIRASGTAWISIAYLAVFGTVIGFVWFYEGVRRLGPTRAGLFINFVPVSAVVLAFVILHEPVTGSLAVGAALVLSGVYLTNRTPREG